MRDARSRRNGDFAGETFSAPVEPHLAFKLVSYRFDEDRINLHKYMISYSGRYAVEGDKVVHQVDVVRFADDFVMTFETHHDAQRLMDVLGKRLDRFGLKLHPDKTHFIDFRPQRHGGTAPDCKAQPFGFLGFTHSWGKSRKGKNVVRQTTAKSRFARSLAAVKDWCRTNRHRPAREQHAWLSAVLNGHYAYYGITANYRRLQEYRHQVVKIWHKWLERRTRGWLLIWANFTAFLARHPLPVARIIHCYTSRNESLS